MIHYVDIRHTRAVTFHRPSNSRHTAEMSEWRSDIVAAVTEVTGLAEDQLVDDADLEALGIDSLDLIEVGMIIEERHDVQLSGEDFEGVTTFSGAVGVFDKVISSSRPAP